MLTLNYLKRSLYFTLLFLSLNYCLYSQSFEYQGRSQAWIKDGSLAEIFIPQDSLTVSITGIRQNTSIQVDSEYFSQGHASFYIYSFHGGDFDIQVSNTGLMPVHSFWVNTAFQNGSSLTVCNWPEAKQLFYSDLTLAPGKTDWINFGDIRAQDQLDYPDKFCFWTSGPDESPDINPGENLYCSGSTVTSTKEAQKKIFKIFPNPADVLLQIDADPTLSSDTKWQIFNVQGQVVESGKLNTGEQITTISTLQLDPGMYAVRIGSGVRLILVEH